jgi:hypothetical protein
MATYNVGFDKTYKAGMDLSNYQYRFVTFNSSGMIINASTLGASVLGVLQNDPKSASEPAVVRLYGFSKIQLETEDAASPIAVGQWVRAASSGRATGLDLVNFAASDCSPGWVNETLATGSGLWAELFICPQRFGT